MKSENKISEVFNEEITEELKSKFFHISQELFLITQPEGPIKWINPAWNILLGYSLSNLINNKFYDLIHPDDINNAEKQIGELIKGISSQGIELRIKNIAGKYKWFLWNADYYKELNLIFALGKDITQQKETEEELKLIKSLVFAFNEFANLEQALNVTLKEICQYTEWPVGEAWIYNSVNDVLIKSTSWSVNSPEINELVGYLKGYITKIGKAPVGKAWSTKESVWINNQELTKTFDNISYFRSAGLNSYYIVPILSDQKVVAAISFFQYEENPPNDKITSLLSAITGQLGSLIDHKNVETRLIENERLLEEIEKITRTGHWEIDYRDSRLFWSHQLFSIYGIKPDENINMPTILRRIHPDDNEKVLDNFVNVINDKKPFTIEYRIIREDGSVRNLISSGGITQQEDGKVTRMVGITQDITAKKLAEEIVQNTEFYFSSLIENEFDIKAIIDKFGTIKYLGPRAGELFGYKTDELINKNVNKFIHPSDFHKLKNKIKTLLNEPQGKISFQYRFIKKDGSLCFLESVMKNMISVSPIDGIIVNTRDITSIKRDEATIESLMTISEKLNSRLNVDQIFEILIYESLKLVDAESGTAGQRTLNGFLIKKYFHNSIPEDFDYLWLEDQELPHQILETKLPFKTNIPVKGQLLPRPINLKYKIKSCVCVPIVDSQQEVIGFLRVDNKKNISGFDREDIEKLVSLSQTAATSIHNAMAYQKIQAAEAELKISHEELRRLSAYIQSAREEERTRISREIHDELGQSLTGLKMDLSWLEKKFMVNEVKSDIIIDKINSMSQLIDSTIKTVRKISSELRPGVLDYLGLPAAVEWQSQDFQKRTGITCKIVTMPAEIKLTQDLSTAVFRIFQETLTNVARHSNANLVEISMVNNESSLILTIKDNGKGITEEELHNKKSLGLVGMRERAELFGGEFKITGTKEGTAVRVKIPFPSYTGNI
jgi:PAS domain S-box-containing protein